MGMDEIFKMQKQTEIITSLSDIANKYKVLNEIEPYQNLSSLKNQLDLTLFEMLKKTTFLEDLSPTSKILMNSQLEITKKILSEAEKLQIFQSDAIKKSLSTSSEILLKDQKKYISTNLPKIEKSKTFQSDTIKKIKEEIDDIKQDITFIKEDLPIEIQSASQIQEIFDSIDISLNKKKQETDEGKIENEEYYDVIKPILKEIKTISKKQDRKTQKTFSEIKRLNERVNNIENLLKNRNEKEQETIYEKTQNEECNEIKFNINSLFLWGANFLLTYFAEKLMDTLSNISNTPDFSYLIVIIKLIIEIMIKLIGR